jgi:hypothetical protein
MVYLKEDKKYGSEDRKVSYINMFLCLLIKFSQLKKNKYVPLMGKTFAVSSCLKTNNSIPKQ